MSGRICGQQRPRSVCVSVKSYQDLHCHFAVLLETIKCVDLQQKPWWGYAIAQADPVLRLSVMPREPLLVWHDPYYNLSLKIESDLITYAINIELDLPARQQSLFIVYTARLQNSQIKQQKKIPKILIFFLFLHKKYDVLLIRSASLRRF